MIFQAGRTLQRMQRAENWTGETLLDVHRRRVCLTVRAETATHEGRPWRMRWVVQFGGGWGLEAHGKLDPKETPCRFERDQTR